MVRTDICVFSEWRIYPGHGQRYVAKDGRGFTFITKKARSLHIRKVKNQRITWTVSWRRHNKKIKSEDAAKKRRKRGGFVQRDIVGIKLADIKKLRNEKPEVRKAQAEQASREIKERKQKQSEHKKVEKKGVTSKDKNASKLQAKAVQKSQAKNTKTSAASKTNKPKI